MGSLMLARAEEAQLSNFKLHVEILSELSSLIKK